MMETLIMGIRNHRSINRALIRLNKINVVGGVNGSGKSTASRILYTFLKAYSSNRWEAAVSEIIDNLNGIRKELIEDGIEDESNLPKELKYDDNYQDIIDCYVKLDEIVKNYLDYSNNQKDKFFNEMKNVYTSLLKQLEKDFGNNFRVECENFIESRYNERIETYRKIARDIFGEDSNRGYYHDDYTVTLLKARIFKDFLSDNSIDLSNYDAFFKRIDDLETNIDDLKIDMYQVEWSSLYGLEMLFSENENLSRRFVLHQLLDKEYLVDKMEPDFQFFVEVSDSEHLLAENYLTENDCINDVFYFDNVSIFDLKDIASRNMGFAIGKNMEHIEHILRKMSNSSDNTDLLDEKTISILEKIHDVIGGKFDMVNYFPFDSISLHFRNEIFNASDKNVVSSGMKQIGIIQLLLLSNRFKKGTYLIIDEPEVNLHPDWQFKFAEILVLLARDLDITIYLNSHSPFFIEAIDAFTEFYDIPDDVNYYLTEESENEGKYDFKKIKSDELYKIYDNLGNAYDLIDQLRLRKHLGEQNGSPDQ